MALQTRRLCHALGAEIGGIDLRKPLADSELREVRRAFLEYGVLLFREQPLTREQHIAFSRQFGEVDDNSAVRIEDYPNYYDPQYPHIFINRPKPNTNPSKYEGNFWHTDHAHKSSPAMATVLRAIEIPDIGGDTLFANMYLAYESLSEGMKKLIEGLYGVHDTGGSKEMQRPTPKAHPLVRVHPETGRKALFLADQVRLFADMTSAESAPLLGFLCKHAARPQFVYRHRWQKNDLLMWDNRSMWHNAVGDYDGAKVRHMERTIVLGTASGGYEYSGPLQ